MCESTTHCWTKQNLSEMELIFCTKLCGNQFDIQCVIGDVIPHDLELLFQHQILKFPIFRKFKYLANNDRYGISYY